MSIGGSTNIDESGYQNSSVHMALAKERSFNLAISTCTAGPFGKSYMHVSRSTTFTYTILLKEELYAK